MRRNHTSRLIAFFLSVLMLLGCVVPLSAAGGEQNSSLNTTTLKEISESLNTISYQEYQDKHPDAVRGTREIVVDVTKYDKTATTAEVEVRKNVADDYGNVQSSALYVGDEGRVAWNVQIPATGKYAIEVIYRSESTKTNSIERMLYINDKVPFSEARYLLLTKTWVHNYEETPNELRHDTNYSFQFDSTGNELRPTTNVVSKWTTYSFKDSNGYYPDAFEFYLEKGTNSIALESVREDVVIAALRLYPYEDVPTYEEKLAEYAANGYKEGTDSIYINAEMPTAVSEYTIYPIYDRSSAISEPQHATKIYRNTIGSDKWTTTGQWIEYEFDVENAGLYTINFRFKQSELTGMYTSRSVTIDGKTPFEEANYLRFNYSTDWQLGPVNDGNVDAFQFYLEPGHHTIRFEVTLGDMGDVVRRVSESIQSINNSYLEIMKLTGASPDEYRDYGFSRVMPDTIENLILESINLNEIIDYMESMNGVRSQYSATLTLVANLLEKMGTDEDEIASNLDELKSYLSTLGTWVSNVSSQPLEVDYILIQGASAELPRAKASFIQSVVHEVKMFVGSFFTDYNSLGGDEIAEDTSSITAWVQTGRDQAQIMRNLIDDKFTPQTGISVNLKLVAAGTLLPSVLAGVGPDVALEGADPIQYAIRGAALPLNDFDTFDEVTSRFTEAAMIPLTLYGKTYGLPETQTFYMMFYRKDILADLGLEIPQTWDDLMAMIPVLQFNNMEVGLPNNYQIFMYQMNGDLWADEGMRINLDSNISLEAFEDMCNMFTQYSLPYTYDFANRFKTGEMPIGIQLYTVYNQLILFATEIAGLWEMAPIPGIEDAEGNINNVSMASVTSIVLMDGCDDLESSWDFMDWWVSKDFQVDYSNELVAVMGQAAKNATANRDALEELPWSSSEYKNLELQMNNLAAVVSYPGSYIIARYTNFAFLDAYNDLADPVDSLLNYINTINKEINRKRKEFEYETVEIGQTLAEKRGNQALLVMETLSGYESEIAAARAAIEAEDISALTVSAEAFASLAGVKLNDLYTAAAEYKDVANYVETFGTDTKAALTSLALYLGQMAKALESYQHT